jgi:hypothetical protein
MHCRNIQYEIQDYERSKRRVPDYGSNRCEADWFLDSPVRYNILIL